MRTVCIVAICSSIQSFFCGKYIKGTADDIDTGINCKCDSFRNVEFFHTPCHIDGDTGVAVDIALEVHLILQKFL